jgi:pimeloyl-ACP methyl ester carboxylesterase
VKLHVHESGTGDKVALLIHGGGADHRTWHAVEAELTARGYRVIAPDLRGHGRSPRGDYTPAALAEDLCENLPAGADLAIGHSLGGLALALAADRLQPRNAVYSDPGFELGKMPPGTLELMRQMFASATAEGLRAACPRWSEADIEVELAAGKLFDFDFLTAVGTFDPDYLPAAPAVHSLIQVADPSLTIGPETAAELAARGFTVRVVPDTNHCIHRDDLDGFFASLEGFV